MIPELKWVKNDPEKYNTLYDGSKFLVALKVHNNVTNKSKWEFEIIVVEADGADIDDGFINILCASTGDVYDSWEWQDFEYFILIEGHMPECMK